MVIKIPALKMLEKVTRHTKSSFKPSLGCSAWSLPHKRAWPSCSDPTYKAYTGHSLLPFHSSL